MSPLLSAVARRRPTLSAARIAAAGVVTFVALAAPAASHGQAPRPLRSAISNALAGTGEEALAFDRIRRAGATAYRLTLLWSTVAPKTRPESFDPANPNDPAYDWSTFDQEVTRVAARGLDPIVGVYDAPVWARLEDRNASPPRPGELGAFARAAAERYSGGTPGVPRIRNWLVWAEPNLTPHLAPQVVGTNPVAPTHYRRMVNEMYDAMHAVRSDNVVIAGGLAPFRDLNVTTMHWGPLTFIRELLCVDRQLRRTCRTTVRFDVWAHHPYTSGAPTRQALHRDDASLGDLPELRALVLAGVRVGNVRAPAGGPQFWVTEFSWDTNPPDPRALPLSLHARWTAEAMYRIWQSGFSLVTWLMLRDYPMNVSFEQSGLYFNGGALARDRPKPALQAFRFPFVGFPRGKTSIFVWGRTPTHRPARIIVEQSFRGGWARIATLSANRYGIFQATIRRRPTGTVRAQIAGVPERARPFSLKAVPDRFVNPFGLITQFEDP